MRGLFITIEGPDGSGKSTQIRLLKSFLEKEGKDVILTREPGGTPISEEIRDLVLSTRNMEMCSRTEALLYAAARAQHVEEVILPAILEGKIVICDRFVDSSLVYQGKARNLGMDKVKEINNFATGELQPDLTFLIHIDAEEGIRRKREQAELDRLERETIDFHKLVSDGYLEVAEKDKNRIKIINGKQEIQEIHEKMVATLNEIL